MKFLIRSLFVSALFVSGAPAWGQNVQFPGGAPAWGQNAQAYGAPAYGAPAYGAPAPAYGALATGQYAPTPGAPAWGQDVQATGAPAWGQQSAQTPPGQMPMGQLPPAATTSSPVDTLCTASTAPAPKAAPDQLGAQVFFRFGGGFVMGHSRGGGDYVDARSATTTNDGRAGFATGFGFNLPLMKDPLLGNTILGEVLIDYAQFSDKTVTTTTSALLNDPFSNRVLVNQLAIVGAPKYRIDTLGNFRPWIIPVGLAFLVNSPPSNNSTYIDLGLHFGAGIDYRITKSISIGADVRYNLNLTHSGVSWMTTGIYLGFDF